MQAGLAGTLALTFAGAVRGNSTAYQPATGDTPLAVLDAGDREVLSAIVPAMLAGTQGPAQVPAVVASVDRALAGLPPHLQREVRPTLRAARFRAGAPLPVRRAPRRGRRPRSTRSRAFLQRWRFSRFAMQQQAYLALHELIDRRLVRASRRMAGDRLSRPAEAVTRIHGCSRSHRRRPRVRLEGARRGSLLDRDAAIDADVAIIGTGAGGGVTADILSAAGLDVVMVEEGALRSSARLPHARGARPIRSSIRSRPRARRTTRRSPSCRDAASAARPRSTGPPASARRSRRCSSGANASGLRELHRRRDASVVRAHGSARWASRPWAVPPNANNDLLRRGADKLGIRTGTIRRNVRDCWNLGYCGMGCPTNAKQSMLVTTIPAALIARRDAARRSARRPAATARAGASPRSRRWRWTRAACVRPGAASPCARSTSCSPRARSDSPAVLMRSGARIRIGSPGTRTFLHPVVISAALMPERGRRLRGRAADHLLRSLSRDRADRRRRSASSSRRRRCIRCCSA